MAERLTMTSDKGGVAFTFDLDITCRPSEAQKILKLAEKLKHYEDLEEQGRLIELRPIKDFENLYAVDMFGEVYGIAKDNANGRRILKRKATKSKQNGYMYITLKDNGRVKMLGFIV